MSDKEKKTRYYPMFRASDCPLSCPSGPPGPQGEQGIQGEQGPTGPGITPVYGSLYSNAVYSAVSGTNVNFDTLGPSSGVTLNTTDHSITVNSPGVYTISFSTVINANDFEGATNAIDFRLSINGTPIITKIISLQTLIAFKNEIDTLSRTDQLILNEGDVIQIFIASLNGNFLYHNAALVVTRTR